MVHLAYCDAKAKELENLLHGKKNMLIRGAAGRKLPHGRVHEGESIYFIENNGDCLIKGRAVIEKVEEFVRLKPEESTEIMMAHMEGLQLTPAQIKRWSGKKCLSIYTVSDIEEIEEPLPFDHQSNMDDWLIVEKIEDVVVGTSIDYNYSKITLK